MISPKEEYKFLNNINNIKNIAFYELFQKYIEQNKRGQDKLTEIESTDQESLLSSKNGGYPIPGMIYTFIYGQLDKISIKNIEKDFIDVTPIVFCLNNDIIKKFKGINLNMLPPQVRLEFLQVYFETFEDFFKTEEALTQNNKLALNKRFIQYIKSGKGQELLKIFNKQTGAKFDYGYRSYSMQFIKKFRMIEYSEWQYIPFFEPKNAFKLIGYNIIQNSYDKF